MFSDAVGGGGEHSEPANPQHGGRDGADGDQTAHNQRETGGHRKGC